MAKAKKKEEVDGGPVVDEETLSPSEEKVEEKDGAWVEFVQNVANDIDDLRKRVEKLEEVEVEEVKTVLPGSTEPSEGGIVETVKEILGDGFDVSIEVAEPGVMFRLIIVPPDQLKEDQHDKRVKNIPYLEGASGAKIYAEKVKEFCIAYAARKGRVYKWPTE